jgi:prepilin-type N-terminal cleavage/methylation domain-containing protein
MGERGFTLLETIVALVILSAAAIAFFEFLSTTLGGARRMELASRAFDQRTNALEIATAVNPMALPEGTLNLGPYSISWSSQRLGGVRQSSGYPIGAGVFKIALYRMVFAFPAADTPPIAVTRIGFRRDTVPQSPLATENVP